MTRSTLIIVLLVLIISPIVLSQSKSNSEQISPGIKISDTWYDMQQTGSMGRMVEWNYKDQINYRSSLNFIFVRLNTFDFLYPAPDQTNISEAYYLFNQGTLETTWGYYNEYILGGVSLDFEDNHGRVVTGPWPDSYYGTVFIKHPIIDLYGETTEYNIIPDTLAGVDHWINSSKFSYSNNKLHVVSQVGSYNYNTGNIINGGLCYFSHSGDWFDEFTYPEPPWLSADPWDYPPRIIDTTYNSTHNITANHKTGKVAIVWNANLPNEGDCDTCSGLSAISPEFDNDLYYQISNDNGLTWQPRVNLTNNAISDKGYRPYNEISVLFDSENNLHILFNATIWPNGPITNPPGPEAVLFHWSENAPIIRQVAKADWNIPNCSPGQNNLNISKMSITESEGKLYAIWVQFNDPANGISDDCSQAGYANGDIWMSSSGNSGFTWTEPQNLTQTYTPNCLPGDCLSEHWPSMVRYGRPNQPDDIWTMADIVDPSGSYTGDYFMDVQYILDKDPGAVMLGEGSWQNNEVRWFRLASVESTTSNCCEVRGDVNFSNSLDIDDLIFLVNYTFKGGSAPLCMSSADINADNTLDVDDLICLVEYTFNPEPTCSPIPCETK